MQNIFWLILITSVYLLPTTSLYLVSKSSTLKRFLKKPFKIWENSYVLVVASLIILSFRLFLYGHINNADFGNFVLHFVGGGVVVSLIFVYLLTNLDFKLNLWQKLISLYFLTSGLGVASELLEFLLDYTTNEKYSQNRWDTWQDLVANSLGALTGFILISLGQKVSSILRKS